MAWFAHIIAGSLYAVGFGAFLYQLLGPNVAGILSDQPLFGIIPFDKLIAVASIAAFTYLNIKGTSETGKTGTIVTIVQLGTILCLIIVGAWTLYDINSNNSPPNSATDNFANFMPNGVAGLVAAMGLTFIAF
jgi:amino acid transporter